VGSDCDRRSIAGIVVFCVRSRSDRCAFAVLEVGLVGAAADGTVLRGLRAIVAVCRNGISDGDKSMEAS